ncbi:MAG: ABC transporter ATP-binding protein [Candidatus Eremiobacteraeota bacterium]|nr:ABC transporter ATP-binding protein [Candidatus Eremiobacteraeota bacterium]MCL5056259.1 ABC transporter ATP-binding protein [Bacillota bacterium]
MIEVRELTKRFGSIQAVSDLSFTIKDGEILGFLGPNGAGKTTTMRMLSGILPPTSGRAIVAGMDVIKNPIEVKRRIGYLPEQVPLYPELTVTEYLDFVGSIWKCGKKERDEVIEECGLSSVSQALIYRLSRGYRQRVGLAQALIHNPDVLILDEPTVGLDPQQIREIRDLIKSFEGKKTVILSTHILPEVSMTCQRVVIIHQGEIAAEGTPESLGKRIESGAQFEIEVQGPQEQIVKVLSSIQGISKVNVLSQQQDANQKFTVETKGEDVRSEIAKAVIEHEWKLLILKTHELTLEEVYVKVLTKEEAA